MLAPAPAGFDAPGQRPIPVAICRLGFRSDGRLTAMLSGVAATRRLTLRQAYRRTLVELEADHRSALDGDEPAGRGPGAAGAVTPTERFLYAIYELVSVHLADLVAGLPRVGLLLDDDLLARLPLETAHRPDRPALFELTQCYRLPATGHAVAPRRRFRLEHHRGDERGLGAGALERALVGNGGRGGTGSPVIHVVGHDPRPPGLAEAGAGGGGQAHVVLSGCDSLPAVLPPGVASVVGTLWPVEDHGCVTVTAAYHRRLAVGVGPLEALRQALLLHRPLPCETWAAWAYLGHPD